MCAARKQLGDKCTNSGATVDQKTQAILEEMEQFFRKSTKSYAIHWIFQQYGPLPVDLIANYFNNGQVHTTLFQMNPIMYIHVESKNEPKVTGDHMWLWHGTDEDSLPLILDKGLQITKQGSKGLVGDGIYFADRASKSGQYCYKGNKRPNGGVLLLCKVFLGKSFLIGETNNDAKVAPPGYHSVECRGQYVPDEEGNRYVEGGLIPMGKTKENKLFSLPTGQGKRLQYNEYVIYDPKRVQVKYVVLFAFSGEKK